MDIKAYRDKSSVDNSIHLPEILRLSNKKDLSRFEQIIQSEAPFIYDELHDQLKELVKISHPSRVLKDEDYEVLIPEHLSGANPDEYGVWVYYPWCKKMIHLLDEEEFVQVRTSRNQYKITKEEQAVLATKKIGVIGLSVGQSVALSMAMERAFGEIRLADFDVLELTNFNRIRTPLYNLGVKKVVAVAREIAEIDPYLKVTIFEEGLQEENMDAFYLDGGKLDGLIDECDGVDMKILCRLKARELQIPVLMEASDRCTIDVERFDLEPDRSILHGYIDHLDVTKLKDLKTNEEKIPYLAPMVGVDTMSARLKASAIEVGHSITTWPQLASAVIMGGGAVADIWRRIALDQYHESGRYFIDMQELVGDEKTTPVAIENPYAPLEKEDIVAVASGHTFNIEESNVTLEEEVVKRIVDAASTAPSGGNAQPWKWVYKNGLLSLFFDKHYGYSYMDFQDTASYIAIGAAVENLVLKTHEENYEVAISYFPIKDDKRLIATFSFYNKGANVEGIEPHILDDLSSTIMDRHTNRKVPVREELPQEILAEIANAGMTVEHAQVTYSDNPDQLMQLGKMIGITDRYRVLTPASHHDFTYQEMRWTEEEAERRKTGMHIGTLELRESELLGLKFVKDPNVVKFIKEIDGGYILRNASVKNAVSASAFGLLTMPSNSAMDFINGGRASQRIWLKATQLGIAFHVMNVPLAYFARLKYAPNELPENSNAEIANLYEQFKGIFGHSSQEEIYLFRLFKAAPPEIVPFRKPIDDILFIV
ncbi:MAG: Rv1355c family protein [Flavipsychrobacter sp.]